MSLFSVTALLVLFATCGTARVSRNVYQRELYPMLLGLPRFCSASGMFADARVDGFPAIMRKRIASLMGRVRGSHNSILNVISDNVSIQLANDWATTNWSFLAPKNIARYIKNLMDCSTHGNAMERLEETELKLSLRLSSRGIIAGDNMDRRASPMKPLWNLLRRWNVRPKTEIGPGAFKVDIVNLPPDTLAKDMKKLLALKKRKENQAKDLNEGNENFA